MKRFLLLSLISVVFLSTLFAGNDTTLQAKDLSTLVTEGDFAEKQPPTFSVKPVDLSYFDTFHHLKMAVEAVTYKERNLPKDFTLALELVDIKLKSLKEIIVSDTEDASHIHLLLSSYLPFIAELLRQANDTYGLDVKSAVEINLMLELLLTSVDQKQFQERKTKELLKQTIKLFSEDILNYALLPLKIIRFKRKGDDKGVEISFKGIVNQIISKAMLSWQRFYKDPGAWIQKYAKWAFGAGGGYIALRNWFPDHKEWLSKNWSMLKGDSENALIFSKNFFWNDGPRKTLSHFWYNTLGFAEKVQINFDDIPGYQGVKEKLRDALRSSKKGRLQAVLLYGPPGTGKSNMANALAKKYANMRIIDPDMAKIEKADQVGWRFLNKASRKPCYLLLDEADKTTAQVREAIKEALEDRRTLKQGSFVIVIVNQDKLLSGPLYSRCEPIKMGLPDKDDTRAIFRYQVEEQQKNVPNDLDEINYFNDEFYNRYTNKLYPENEDDRVFSARALEQLVRNAIAHAEKRKDTAGKTSEKFKLLESDFDAVFEDKKEHAKKVLAIEKTKTKNLATQLGEANNDE